MLRKRIVALLIVKNGIVVQSIGFKRFLPVGSVEVSVEFLSSWGIDEIILLDIDASRSGRGPDLDLVRRASRKGFVPLTVGGGISSLDDMNRLIHCGADKISINKAALTTPDLVKRAAEVLGIQCIVVSMDVRRNDQGEYEVFADNGRTATGLHPLEWARTVEKLGAGEILLNSIDRDGAQQGYDIDLLKSVAEGLEIPVIACGGVGSPLHFQEAFEKTPVSAAAAGNFFHFTEHSPVTAKSFLREKQVPVRLDTHAQYGMFKFERRGRVKKRDETDLEKLRFEVQVKEVI